MRRVLAVMLLLLATAWAQQERTYRVTPECRAYDGEWRGFNCNFQPAGAGNPAISVNLTGKAGEPPKLSAFHGVTLYYGQPRDWRFADTTSMTAQGSSPRFGTAYEIKASSRWRDSERKEKFWLEISLVVAIQTVNDKDIYTPLGDGKVTVRDAPLDR